jgi:hypothetical protein
MSVIPADVDESSGPPTAIPLAHFVVALAYLVAGLATAALTTGWAGQVAHVHLFVAGWICLTILGAMTQFVPVWSGVSLHSRRLAVLQLPLAGLGFAGLAVAFLTGALWALPVAGAFALAGVWVFCYNLARTVAGARPFDATETHFAVALAWFVVLTVLGIGLAVDFSAGVLPVAGVDHAALRSAHATAAVFGAVLTTVLGALYQLGTMFTQTELGPVESRFQRVETVAYPLGVAALVAGRLFAVDPLARVGGVLVALSVLGIAVVIANKLRESRVEWTPMLTRYSLAAAGLGIWALAALVTWAGGALAPTATFGAPGTGPLVLAGAIAFVVLGTIYHIIPFLVWVDRYSDKVGLEPVPMVDDLYLDRLAAVDGVAYTGGVVLVVAASVAPGLVPPLATTVGWGLATLGGVVFAANLLVVVVEHGEYSVRTLVSA